MLHMELVALNNHKDSYPKQESSMDTIVIPSKVCCSLYNVGEYSWPFQVLHAKNIMPGYQTCSEVVQLPMKGKLIILYNIVQKESCTFLDVATIKDKTRLLTLCHTINID